MALCALAPAASAHQGNPNYNSQVRAIVPAVKGLDAQVLGADDRIEIRNRTGSVVVVEGYRHEPYLRFLPDGTVQVNQRSPALYLNEDRFAQAQVPRRADPGATPSWKRVGETGRYDWHDHRIHWMAKAEPEQVRKDESRRVKVFDWKLPMSVAGRSVVIEGSLTWLGKDDEGFPLPAAISLAAAVIVGATLVAVVRRRRRDADDEPDEAW
jgi:hypothetical protein